MRLIENQEFTTFHDRGGGFYHDLHFKKCKFLSSSISITEDPTKRSVVRNVALEGCRVQGSSVRCAIVEDTVVDGLQTANLLQAWGTLFRRVTLKGKVGRLMISPLVSPQHLNTPLQQTFDDERERYYANMDDFALDISKAEAVELEITGIPARLIKRDAETQAVVTRQAALSGEWRELEHVQGTGLAVGIQQLLKARGGTDDIVLVAHKRSRNFKKRLAGIEELRAAGVALPD